MKLVLHSGLGSNAWMKNTKTTFKRDFAPFVNYVVDMMAAFEGCTHSGGKGKKLRKASKRPARSLKNYSTCSSYHIGAENFRKVVLYIFSPNLISNTYFEKGQNFI